MLDQLAARINLDRGSITGEVIGSFKTELPLPRITMRLLMNRSG
jgi:hypothetical protein